MVNEEKNLAGEGSEFPLTALASRPIFAVANDAFMREYLASTRPNPFCRREQIWEVRAAFEVEVFDGSIHLGCVRSLERGKGDGSAALDWFCALADKHGVSIRGTVKPCGSTMPRLTAAQLRAWYKRHDFKVSRQGCITRNPAGQYR